jgi:S1-C subfamily serine protease
MMIRLFVLCAFLNQAVAAQAQSQTDAQVQVPQTQAQVTMSFAPLVKQAAPAVVNIYAKPPVNEPFCF